MEEPKLKLVTERARHDGTAPAGRGTALSLAGLLAAAGLLATVLDVNPARRPLPAVRLAGIALEEALARGNTDEAVLSRLIELRRSLGRRPLDSRTRAVYAGLLLDLCRRLDDARAASFHASRAAALAPVSVGIVAASARVLARSGSTDHALALARVMFGYDRGAAAKLLADLELLVPVSELERGLADDARAWIAWSARLRRAGRAEDANAWVDRAHQRWPADLETVQLLAARAVHSGDWDALEELLATDLDLTDSGAAPVLLYRARLDARRGREPRARAAIEDALAREPGSVLVKTLAGDAWLELGAPDEARRLYNRALFDVAPVARRRLLVRLARLEDEHGEPARALRQWRAVLELDPDHAEAARRVADLTGGALDPLRGLP